jgi:hypothetical protein
MAGGLTRRQRPLAAPGSGIARTVSRVDARVGCHVSDEGSEKAAMAPARPVGARSGLRQRNSRPWTRRRGLHGRGSLSEGWPRLALCRNLPGTARMVIPARFCGTAWLPPPPYREYNTQPCLFRPRGQCRRHVLVDRRASLPSSTPTACSRCGEFAFGTAPHPRPWHSSPSRRFSSPYSRTPEGWNALASGTHNDPVLPRASRARRPRLARRAALKIV